MSTLAPGPSGDNGEHLRGFVSFTAGAADGRQCAAVSTLYLASRDSVLDGANIQLEIIAEGKKKTSYKVRPRPWTVITYSGLAHKMVLQGACRALLVDALADASNLSVVADVDRRKLAVIGLKVGAKQILATPALALIMAPAQTAIRATATKIVCMFSDKTNQGLTRTRSPSTAKACALTTTWAVSVDDNLWHHVGLFSLSRQWPTTIKTLPVAVFERTDSSGSGAAAALSGAPGIPPSTAAAAAAAAAGGGSAASSLV